MGVLSLLALAGPAVTPAPHDARKLVLVTLDGVRIEEMFAGLDAAVLAETLAATGKSMAASPAAVRFGANTAEERRRRLLPFFWGTLMTRHGSIAGDASRGSHVRLANRQRLSYPGYAELLTGRARDEAFDSNEPRPNPYPSFLEFLAGQVGDRPDDVAVFGSWATIGAAAQGPSGRLFVNAGLQPYVHPDPWAQKISALQFDAAPPWEGVRGDAFTFELALVHLRTRHPRALWIALDETDELAHEGRYEAYLLALHRIDDWLRRLHETLEADPYYRGRTSIVITVDHGRGRGLGWRDHGAAIPGSEDAWVAFAGPFSPRRGTWTGGEEIRVEQLGATMLDLLGLDWNEGGGVASPAVSMRLR